MNMAQANNDDFPPPHVLRVGWWGESHEAGAFLNAIDSCAEFHVSACAMVRGPGDEPPSAGAEHALARGKVANQERNSSAPEAGAAAKRASSAPEPRAAAVEWLGDARDLLEQARVQALVLAGPTRDALELSRAALDRGIHVWRRPPLGRDIAEAIAAAKQAQRARVVLQIGTWWHVVRALAAHLTAASPAAGSSIELFVSAIPPPNNHWRSLRAEAGGGVLLQEGYALLEAMLEIGRLPDAVYGVTGRGRRDGATASRDTEDWAAALFRYAEGGSALVRCGWNSGPAEARLVRHSGTDSLLIEPERVLHTDANGRPIQEIKLPAGLLQLQMREFARSIVQEKGPDEALHTLHRHVAASAVMEAVYLSARTSQPESPRNLYELHDWPEPRI